MKTLVLPSVTDLSHEFPFITKDELKYRRLYNKYKTKKVFLNLLVRVNDNYKQRSEKPDVHINRYENDMLTAGCHRIAYSEMESIAKQLGWA